MKLNMRKFIKTSLILFTSAFVLLSSACNIGLGEAVDLTAPEVSIISPDFMASICSDFEATGTAADNQSVKKLVISFDNEKWTYENGTWDKAGASLDNGVWKVNLSLPSGSGEYVLSVSATDAMKNSGSKSFASRTVVYDKDPPKVTVTEPSKLYPTSAELTSTILSGGTYKDFTYISEYLNGDSLTVQGYQDEKYSLKKLTVWIKDSSGVDVYSKTLTENLRNWSISVPKSDLGDNQKLYQVITESEDEAGNKELPKSHGFFCWWPAADKPWIETTKLEPTSTINSDSEANYYPGYKFQGQCFDDDGIKSVTVQLYDSANNAIANGKYEYTAETEDDIQSFFPWTITLPETTGVVKLVAKCTDKNDVSSETTTGFLNILDITIPRVEVTNPSQTVSLFGDKDGNVTFEGVARDDSGIASVKMVWLKDEQDLLSYSRAENNLWKVSDGTTDAKGNKVWVADLGTGVRGTSQIEYAFSKTINIFSHLDIGTNSLIGQTFIFRVEDTSGKATTLTYAVQGDIKKPEITITKVYVKYSDEEIKTLTPEDTLSLPAFGENTLVMVEGTWSDDSTEIWEDKTKVSDSITVEGLTSPTISVTGNKWSTDYVKNAASGGLSIKATITDLAGSSSVAKASYAINTDEAEFEKITAANADGTFRTGDTITIQMKFTKAVTVTGNPVLKLSNGKEVSLKATTNHTKIHEFEYTITTGDDVSGLNATIKNAASCTWKDTSSKSPVQVVLDASNDLAYNKNIDIVTKAPVIESTVLNADGDELTITFKSTIYKNVGDMLLSQDTVSAVPVVLTESEFKKLKNKKPAFENYYEKTTNGCDNTGKADLKTKYVLKYSYDSTNTTLISLYKAAKAHEVSMNIRSSNISVSGNKLVIKLTGSYALPCKGAKYTIKIPEGFVTDVVGNNNTENNTNKVTMPGIENPVIRVSTGSSSYNTSKFTATQPLNSEFKIDCETPGSSIKYGIESRQYDYTYHCETHDQTKDNGDEDSDGNRYKETSAARAYDPLVYANMDLGVGSNGVATSCPYPKQGTAPDEPATLGKTYSRAVKIGSSSWTCGEKYLIAAQAVVSSTNSDKCYATANRSLFVFNNNNSVGCDTASNQRIWLRGGDSETGGVMTAGFPLSWSPENGKSGIALLTQDSTNKNLWYYLTWELNTTAYVGVVRGEADASSATNGAVADTEVFGVNAWVPFKKWYCVYPGESRVVETKRYEAVYGKHRDFFKWNEVSSGPSEDDDLEKMTVHDTMDAGYNTSTTAFDCTDIWQKTKIKKWGSDTSSEGAYLIVETAASAQAEATPYVDVWSYNYGSRVVVRKVAVTPGETAKIKISKEFSDRWKYDDLYVGGLGVKITSVEMYMPTSSNIEIPNASVLTAGAKIIVTTDSDLDSVVDEPGFTVGSQWITAEADKTYTITLTESDVTALASNGYILSSGISIKTVQTPVHENAWTKLTSISEGEVIKFTVSESDGLVSASECFVMFNGTKISVVPGGDASYTFTSTDVGNSWKFTGDNKPEIYSYGVTITGKSISSPYTECAITGSVGWGEACTLVVTFEKLTDFNISEPTICIYNWQDNEKVTLTEAQINAGTYTYSSLTGANYEKVKGYGVKINSAVISKN